MGSIFGGGKSKDATTTQTQEPWSGQAPFLTDVFGQAQNQFRNQSPQYQPFQGYVPFSPQTELGLNTMFGRGRNSSPLLDASRGLTMDTIGGSYLPGGQGQNPYLDEAFNRSIEQSLPYMNSLFGEAGRTGGDAHTNAISELMGDTSYNIYGKNYDQERNRQMQGLLFGPQLAAQDYQDIQAMLQAGGAIEGKAGEVLQDRTNRFNFEQNQPAIDLARYAALIQGTDPGGTSTTTQPTFNNTAGGILGGGLAGAGLAASFPGSPAWPFALGGAALGLFGNG